jgi:hypothetical protein
MLENPSVARARGLGSVIRQIPSPILLALAAIGLGVVTGVAVVAASPLYVVAGLVGLAGLATLFANWRYSAYGFVLVATLLPYGVIPIPIGVVKLTLVDVCLTAGLLTWLFRILADRAEEVRSSGMDLPVLLYLGACLTSFILGTGYLTTTSDARLFLKMLNSILFFFVVVNNVRSESLVRRLLQLLTVGGSVVGLLAIALYVTPAPTATRLLASLARLGYPDTNILQYDATTHVLRAIGTSIDPNILGATLMVCGVVNVGLMAVPQAARWRLALVGLLVPTVVGLLLTYSRGSLVGFLAGCGVIATLRYRRLWLIALVGVALLAVSGELARSSFVTHLETGLAVQDQATQMRFGEYKDAFRLILAYPIFGVGFGTAPDVDLYVGVSSIYLLIAENTGLVGLAIWVWVIAAAVLRSLRRVTTVSSPLMTIAVGLLGALVAMLVAGLFDHHFVDLNQPHVVGLVWLVLGLLAACLQIQATPSPVETGEGQPT